MGLVMLIGLIIIIIANICDSAKILVVYPAPSRSHDVLGKGIVRHLLKAGHEVTYITPFPDNKPQKNLREIDVSTNTVKDIDTNLNIRSLFEKTVKTPNSVSHFFFMLLNLNKNTLNHPNVQQLVNDPNEQFDTVIAEWIYTEFNAGYAVVFNCPLIWTYSQEVHWMLLTLVDESVNPAFNADNWSGIELPLSFIQRVSGLWILFKDYVIREFYYYYIDKTAYIEGFGPVLKKRSRTLPCFDDVRYNASLVFNNWHTSLGTNMKMPKNSIDVAGYHIDDVAEPIPQDLHDILDNAKNGLIYFSMGSILKSKDLPTEIKRDLLNMFAKLQFTVLWKFEEPFSDLIKLADVENIKNVHVVKWAPQQSILSHKNCKLFITHGGLLSTTEALHFGVPTIGIPVFGDHFGNINRLVYRGFGKRVDLSYNLADDLKKEIEDILNNDTYTEKARQISFIYHHRPTSPGKELVHWIEHVVETRGAPHLRSPALLVSWYQKTYLDLISAIIVIIFTVILIIRKMNVIYKDMVKKKM